MRRQQRGLVKELTSKREITELLVTVSMLPSLLAVCID